MVQIQVLNGNPDLLERKFLSVRLQASKLQSLDAEDTAYSLDNLYIVNMPLSFIILTC